MGLNVTTDESETVVSDPSSGVGGARSADANIGRSVPDDGVRGESPGRESESPPEESSPAESSSAVENDEADRKGAPLRRGRALVRASSEFASEDRSRSWFYLLSTCFIFVGLLAACASSLPLALRIGLSVLAGLVQVRLFVIYHDYLHHAILGKSKLASWIFQGFGLFTMSPASVWQETHDHHHRNNCRRFGFVNVGSFPVMTVDEYEACSKSDQFKYRTIRHPLTIFGGYISVFLLGFCVQAICTRAASRPSAILSLVTHFGAMGLAGWFFGVDAAILSVFLPAFIGGALGSYLFYAQHNYPGAKYRTGADWDYADAALLSSSFFQMGPVFHWFTANIGYHHVHHLNSRIPFYRLPEAMDKLDELQQPGTTSLWPRDVLRCLSLALWDPARDRLVSFAEARTPANRSQGDPATT
ncbi:MAG: fatty acid desaturase [Planctomycetota bacterium]